MSVCIVVGSAGLCLSGNGCGGGLCFIDVLGDERRGRRRRLLFQTSSIGQALNVASAAVY